MAELGKLIFKCQSHKLSEEKIGSLNEKISQPPDAHQWLRIGTLLPVFIYKVFNFNPIEMKGK